MADDHSRGDAVAARGDTFTGYMLARLEQEILYLHQRLEQRFDLVDQKLDALGSVMTPEERATYIARLNDDAAKLTAASTKMAALAKVLDQTGKPE